MTLCFLYDIIDIIYKKGAIILEYTLVAPCYFGVESAAAFDFKRIGAKNVTVTDGRVTFQGDAEILAAANLESRCAERILILLKSTSATTFDALFDAVFEIPWEEIIPPEGAFPVKGSSLSSQLSSVPACQSIVKKAIVERLKKGHRVQSLPETGAVYQVRVSLRKDVAEIMLDTSGAGLHKRGYRRTSTLAPIKETLAAAMIDLGRIYPDTKAVDPFCGSGTLMIEAALKAANVAPGLRRRFAAEEYDFISKKAWETKRAQAIDSIRRDTEFQAIGYDIDPQAVEIAQANAKKAGVARLCHFEVADVKTFCPTQEMMLFTNPPYGERLGDLRQAAQLETMLGKRLAEYPVRSTYVITADAEFEINFGKKARRRRKMYNGMIPCQVYMYF